ncbi:MAG: hypothetical protein ACI81R_000480 [Bradymonadia bacterium]|jgi:hypothetical protein
MSIVTDARIRVTGSQTRGAGERFLTNRLPCVAHVLLFNGPPVLARDEGSASGTEPQGNLALNRGTLLLPSREQVPLLGAASPDAEPTGAGSE